MRHKAKIDWWIGTVIFLSPLIPIASFPQPPAIATTALSLLVIFGFLFPQSYETTETELVIRAGLRTIRIPYAAITAVKPSSDGRSALAIIIEASVLTVTVLSVPTVRGITQSLLSSVGVWRLWCS